MTNDKYYILAEEGPKNEYSATEIESSWEKIYEGFEYGDVFEGIYQLWEYPSGKVFRVEPDRKVEDKDYYSAPNKLLWMPKLTIVETNIDKVTEAYNQLSNLKKSI